MSFQLTSNFQPSGDQVQAISELTKRVQDNCSSQILMGVTGSGKTFTIANVIQEVQRPTLILAHNKTLAAQLCSEFQQFFPNNAVEYFVSYYDYYQPEAYLPARDMYIEKEADINEEIERLRHRATIALLTRRDVIIVASVSCIYGLGMPDEYLKGVITVKTGQTIDRKSFLLQLDHIRYERNDVELKQGRYRIKGDVIDLYPSWEEKIIRFEFFGDELEKIMILHPVSLAVEQTVLTFSIFPATHYVVDADLSVAIERIKAELASQVKILTHQQKILEAHRLEQRTKYDVEMMQEVGTCKGIENYSRQLWDRRPGDPPGVLLDFFPDDLLVVVDESHVTIPQVRGMYAGDQSRKETLIAHGFRLPSAKDNRPLTFKEFIAKVPVCIYVSATPGPYELMMCGVPSGVIQHALDKEAIIQQIIRPTGLIDPDIEVKPTCYQVDDLMIEIDECIKRNERVLVTTITKKMSEDLCGFLDEKGVKVQYLHSEVHALDRVDILRDLRAGKYDVLIGVNLLREGLDLPEVSLVAILDADKEGFLRNERSLIQTIGRAARHVNGRVLMYADKLTDSMKRAIDETNRRRSIQMEYNDTHNIQPQSIIKDIVDIRDETREEEKKTVAVATEALTSVEDIELLIAKLEKDMANAAKQLEFELAAVIRDQIETLRGQTPSLGKGS